MSDPWVAVWGSSGKVAITAETEHALEAIRARGHRVGDSRQLAGVRDISVPVIGPAGDATAVVTCPFLQRVDRKTPNEAGTLTELHRLAADISVDCRSGGPRCRRRRHPPANSLRSR